MILNYFKITPNQNLTKIKQGHDKGNILIKSLFGLCLVPVWSLVETIPKARKTGEEPAES